jgi:hypothetical protein
MAGARCLQLASRPTVAFKKQNVSLVLDPTANFRVNWSTKARHAAPHVIAVLDGHKFRSAYPVPATTQNLNTAALIATQMESRLPCRQGVYLRVSGAGFLMTADTEALREIESTRN